MYGVPPADGTKVQCRPPTAPSGIFKTGNRFAESDENSIPHLSTDSQYRAITRFTTFVNNVNRVERVETCRFSLEFIWRGELEFLVGVGEWSGWLELEWEDGIFTIPFSKGAPA